uniref:Uncharacterized protein n=1 Tax=Panagrolaimus sp. ES5 TaxID=591445 RepID=A0AC34G0Q4_9BILA
MFRNISVLPPLIIHAPASDFPSDILKWMKKDAKPKMALKLMKCHKYFQHQQFPYFVVKSIACYDGQDILEVRSFYYRKYYYKGLEVCDIKRLTLRDQELLIDEFKFLASSGTVESLVFYATTIKKENGDIIFFDQLLEFLPNVENIRVFNYGATLFSSNFDNIFAKINTSKFKDFDVRMTFYNDFEKFIKFVKHNPHICYEVCLLNEGITGEQRHALEKYVQQIIDAGLTEFPPPQIIFNGQIQKKRHAVQMLRDQFNKRKNVKIELVSWFSLSQNPFP